MFSQVSICPQSASWILAHCSALLKCGRYASYWNSSCSLWTRTFVILRILFVTGRNEVVAKVMFLHVCVILFTGGLRAGPPETRQTPPPDQADTPPRTRQTPPGTRQTPPGPSRHPPDQADTLQTRQPPPPAGKKTAAQHTINERPVRILLECILVPNSFPSLMERRISLKWFYGLHWIDMRSNLTKHWKSVYTLGFMRKVFVTCCATKKKKERRKKTHDYLSILCFEGHYLTLFHLLFVLGCYLMESSSRLKSHAVQKNDSNNTDVAV